MACELFRSNIRPVGRPGGRPGGRLSSRLSSRRPGSMYLPPDIQPKTRHSKSTKEYLRLTIKKCDENHGNLDIPESNLAQLLGDIDLLLTAFTAQSTPLDINLGLKQVLSHWFKNIMSSFKTMQALPSPHNYHLKTDHFDPEHMQEVIAKLKTYQDRFERKDNQLKLNSLGLSPLYDEINGYLDFYGSTHHQYTFMVILDKVLDFFEPGLPFGFQLSPDLETQNELSFLRTELFKMQTQLQVESDTKKPPQFKHSIANKLSETLYWQLHRRFLAISILSDGSVKRKAKTKEKLGKAACSLLGEIPIVGGAVSGLSKAAIEHYMDHVTMTEYQHVYRWIKHFNPEKLSFLLTNYYINENQGSIQKMTESKLEAHSEKAMDYLYQQLKDYDIDDTEQPLIAYLNKTIVKTGPVFTISG